MIRNITAATAFVAVAVGFALAWLPLGLIVPGSMVLAALIYGHLHAPPPQSSTQQQTPVEEATTNG